MANFNFNKVILGGRLTGEPEMRQTQSGIAMVTFSIAVNRRFARQSDGSQQENAQPQADFFNVIAWRQTAEFVARYFHKGSSICVMGSIQNRSWTDPQNVKHYATDIVADEVNFVDSKNDNGYSNYGQAPAYSQGFAPQNAPAKPAQSSAPAPKSESQYTPDNYNPAQFAGNAPQSGSASGFQELGDDENLPF
ncbi:MAG: single-stranded DNA-binding protein [Eubacteriales bacterium]